MLTTYSHNHIQQTDTALTRDSYNPQRDQFDVYGDLSTVDFNREQTVTEEIVEQTSEVLRDITVARTLEAGLGENPLNVAVNFAIEMANGSHELNPSHIRQAQRATSQEVTPLRDASMHPMALGA